MCSVQAIELVLDGVLKMKKADGHEPSAEHKMAIRYEDLAADTCVESLGKALYSHYFSQPSYTNGYLATSWGR